MARFLLLTLLAGLLLPLPAQAARVLTASKVKTPPQIDGSGDDAVWKSAPIAALPDRVSNANIFLQAVHDGERVYFLVRFPDMAQNPLHKPWIWDKEKGAYAEGPHREDTFVFKWNMLEREVDLSNFSEDSYRADVWYWKANRSNPAGYADDQYQVLADAPPEKGKITETVSPGGKKRYLSRHDDAGRPASTEYTPKGYERDTVDRYPKQQPEGSRADVRAKGVWKDGFWVVEFARKLTTGNDDDVQFAPASGKRYLFGVSIFSLYGNPLNRSQPNLYGMGRISEPLHLEFR